MNRLETPVVLILFNRPEQTKRVFESIARAKPTQLFLVADGPRPGVSEDTERCRLAREYVSKVDWDCEVHRRFSEENLGCGYGPATGISWAFKHVEEAIILEDDCLPDPSFFPYCSELLSRYRGEEKVMVISGTNFTPRRKKISSSYVFLRASGMCFWGWATWRRAWKHHDMKIQSWRELRKTNLLESIYGNPTAVEKWRGLFDRAYAAKGDVDYWDYQWTHAIWSRKGLAVSPNQNLISNIGFGESATHTKSSSARMAEFPTEPIELPLRHPETVSLDREEEAYRIRREFPQRSLMGTLYRRSRALVRRMTGG